MSTSAPKRDDTFLYVVGIGVLFAFMIGPVSFVAAVIVVIIGLALQLRLAASLLIAGVGFIAGLWLHGIQDWLTGPITFMAGFYRDYVFPAMAKDANAFWGYMAVLLLDIDVWRDFGPLGMMTGGAALTAREVMLGGPVRSTAGGRPPLRERVSWFAGMAKKRVDQHEAATPAGSLLGVDQTSGRQVMLSDREANTHTLVLGTTGSGKTVTVLNMVESAIDRGLPVVYIDGKGDQALAESVVDYAWSKGRPAYLFSLAGESCCYNPLASGGYSAKKDRIIELRDWSEDHYRKLAEGYMQTVFKVLEAVEIKTDLVTVADHMSTDRLQALIRKSTKRLGERRAQALSDQVEAHKPAEAHVESLRAEIRNLAWSEVGHLFATHPDGAGEVAEDDDGALGGFTGGEGGSAVLELQRAIEEQAVVYFCLPALQFPALADLLGKLVINDLKSAAHSQLVKPAAARRPIYTVFDEFSVFAGEQVLNVINMGRSAGLHAVLATQSVADIGRAVPLTPDHFIRQVFSSCNTYLVQRLNAPEDATLVAEAIGTKDDFAHTAQLDGLGSTGMGSVRRTKSFVVHPDVIKQLPMGEAIFVNKIDGDVKRLKVRHGRIGRDA